jgi:outer membrane receptor protein involved in Fe transport
MSQPRSITFTSLIIATLPVIVFAADTQKLPTLYIDAQQTANLQPVATYESPVSNLGFEPRVDLQSRGMAEAQGDVTVRGGIFENTGFRVGSATLIDPQTGHYFAELPIAPEMLKSVEVLTGTENALYGFNSSVGTLSYGWSEIQTGGSLTIGVGDHDLNYQRIHHAQTGSFGESDNWSWGIEAEISRSESDGTIEYGDHDFDRSSGRVQILGPNSQTDLFAGYQAKRFGWPELYAPPYGANETENLKTRLFIVNHRQNYGADSYWEATGYTRRHSDHYIFNRFSPNDDFVHETEVSALAVSGKHAFNTSFSLNYAAQFTADEIDSSTLEHSFTSRSYFKASLLPEYQFKLNETDSLSVSAGASFDDTNRNESAISPMFEITWLRARDNGDRSSVYLSLAESSQVAGYTAIGGQTTGLFASDPELERETSDNLELGMKINRADWSFETAIFYRWDDDLVDWTYSNDTSTARTANNVDLETLGLEFIGTKRWGTIEGIASYTYLHKDSDYGDSNIDASFYALNFAKHRITLGTIWRPTNIIEVRIDNEWRENEENSLRDGSNSALFTNLALSVYPPQIEALELFFAIDNAWDDDFEDVPGTSGRGDQYSAGMTYRW